MRPAHMWQLENDGASAASNTPSTSSTQTQGHPYPFTTTPTHVLLLHTTTTNSTWKKQQIDLICEQQPDNALGSAHSSYAAGHTVCSACSSRAWPAACLCLCRWVIGLLSVATAHRQHCALTPLAAAPTTSRQTGAVHCCSCGEGHHGLSGGASGQVSSRLDETDA